MLVREPMAREIVVTRPSERSLSEAPPVGEALVEVVRAGQRLLIDRVDLARLEMKAALERALTMALAAIAGGTLLLYAWIQVMAALVHLLERVMSPAAATLLVGFCNAVLGAVAIGVGLTVVKRGQSRAEKSASTVSSGRSNGGRP